jgi:hypothetical protein
MRSKFITIKIYFAPDATKRLHQEECKKTPCLQEKTATTHLEANRIFSYECDTKSREADLLQDNSQRGMK